MAIRKPTKPRLYISGYKQRRWPHNPGPTVLEQGKEALRKEIPTEAIDIYFRSEMQWDFYLYVFYKIPLPKEEQDAAVLRYHQKRTAYRTSLLKALDDLNAEELAELKAAQ